MAKSQRKKAGHLRSRQGTARAAPGELQIPGWIAPVLYAVVTLMLFASFVFSNQMLFGQDTLSLGYMAREFYAQAVRAGDPRQEGDERAGAGIRSVQVFDDEHHRAALAELQLDGGGSQDVPGAPKNGGHAVPDEEGLTIGSGLRQPKRRLGVCPRIER